MWVKSQEDNNNFPHYKLSPLKYYRPEIPSFMHIFGLCHATVFHQLRSNCTCETFGQIDGLKLYYACYICLCLILPLRPDEPSQDESLFIVVKVHDTWCLKLTSDPVSLLLVVDEHKLHSNVITVNVLKK